MLLHVHLQTSEHCTSLAALEHIPYRSRRHRPVSRRGRPASSSNPAMRNEITHMGCRGSRVSGVFFYWMAIDIHGCNLSLWLVSLRAWVECSDGIAAAAARRAHAKMSVLLPAQLAAQPRSSLKAPFKSKLGTGIRGRTPPHTSCIHPPNCRASSSTATMEFGPTTILYTDVQCIVVETEFQNGNVTGPSWNFKSSQASAPQAKHSVLAEWASAGLRSQRLRSQTYPPAAGAQLEQFL